MSEDPQPAPDRRPLAEGGSGSEASPPRALIADNDAHVAVILAAFLGDEGIQVESVEDGEAALDRLRAGGLDLLVCDLCMPKMAGEEVVRAMDQEGLTVPTFVISGFLDEARRAEFEQLPFVHAVLRKPFDLRGFARQAAECIASSERSQKGPGSA